VILSIATALAIGIYVVVSKDMQHKRLDATSRESLQPLGRLRWKRSPIRREVSFDGARKVLLMHGECAATRQCSAGNPSHEWPLVQWRVHRPYMKIADGSR